MKFSTLSFSAIMAAVLAQESGNYGLVAIHSGDVNVHLQSFKLANDGLLSLNGQTELTVYYDQKTGRLTVAGSNPTQTLTVGAPDFSVSAQTNDGSGGFAINSDQEVTFNNQQNFYVVPGNGQDNYVLHAGGPEPSNAVGIVLHAEPLVDAVTSAPAASQTPPAISARVPPAVVNGAVGLGVAAGTAMLAAGAALFL